MNTSPISFYERPYPSANSILLHGGKPVLVDSGFGSDVLELERWLNAQSVPPAELSLIVNTHHHTDHVGGNHHLQSTYHLPIAAHAWEGRAVNRRDPEVCLGRWLTQPVEAYHVNTMLQDGHTISTGNEEWKVRHTPGHSLGHVTLHHPERRAAITGDALLAHDLGWFNFHRDGLNAADRALESLDKLEALNLSIAYPGHGPVITDVPKAIASSRARIQKLQTDPMKIGWHGSKRIFAFALMINGPMTEPEIHAYLHSSPWVHDYARDLFHVPPEKFIQLLIDEMLRSGAATWNNHRLQVNAPHQPPPPGWATTPTRVSDWPAIPVNGAIGDRP